jgi:hypothetical protein
MKNVFLLVFSHLLSAFGWLIVSANSIIVVFGYLVFLDPESNVFFQFSAIYLVAIVLVRLGKLLYSKVDHDKVAIIEIKYLRTRTKVLKAISILIIVISGLVCLNNIVFEGSPIQRYLSHLLMLIYGIILLLVSKRLKRNDYHYFCEHIDKNALESRSDEKMESIANSENSGISDSKQVSSDNREMLLAREPQEQIGVAKKKLFCGHCGSKIVIEKSHCPTCGNPY